MTTTSACFTMDGQWFAEFACTRYREGAWDRALAMITDSLDGITTDQAIAILRGRATLSGDSSTGIELVELSDTHEAAVAADARDDYMFGKLFRRGDKVYRPYAVVSGWCKEDYTYSCTNPTIKTVGDLDDRRNGAARPMYYAHDPSRDLLVKVPMRVINDCPITDVLCEEFQSTVPFWIKLSTNDPVEFVNNLLNECEFPVYGAFRYNHMKELDDIDNQAQTTVPDASLDTKVDKQMNKDHKQSLLVDAIEAASMLAADAAATPEDIRRGETTFESVVDQTHHAATDETWDAIESTRASLTQRHIALVRTAIVEQATQHGGFFELLVDDRVLNVPRNPFLIWALRGPFKSDLIDFEAHGHERPVWTPVSPSGEKMYGDDPCHTDWLIGAGLTPSQGYDDQLISAAYNVRHQLVEQYTGHQFITLAKGNQRYIFGEVYHPGPGESVPPGSVAVIPHAGPEYQLAMESANRPSPTMDQRGCVICNVGGKLAHLAVVGREISATVLMLPNATSMYRVGQGVHIDMDKGVVAITA